MNCRIHKLLSLTLKQKLDEPDEHGDSVLRAAAALQPILGQGHLREELHDPGHLTPEPGGC